MNHNKLVFYSLFLILWGCSPKVGQVQLNEQIDNSVYKIVEKMPMYGDCSTLECSNQAMLDFYYSKLEYPQIARSRGLEGKVYLEFIIEKDGRLTGAQIVRDIGLGCGEAALKALKLMDKWNPGYQKGKAVRVAFVLPVTFKL